MPIANAWPKVITVSNAEEVVQAIQELLKEKKFTAVGVGLEPGGKADPWVLTSLYLESADDVRVRPIPDADWVAVSLHLGGAFWTIPVKAQDEDGVDQHTPTLEFHDGQVHITMRKRNSNSGVSKIVLAPER